MTDAETLYDNCPPIYCPATAFAIALFPLFEALEDIILHVLPGQVVDTVAAVHLLLLPVYVKVPFTETDHIT